MDLTIQILEELLENDYRGLIYIDETGKIGAYSEKAKEITGLIQQSNHRHPEGVLNEGDIVIIADNEIGDDDALRAPDLQVINIEDDSIAAGDAIVAVGVYKNKKIQPQYKWVRSHSPSGLFELKTNYLGFDIVSAIDFGKNCAEIVVKGQSYLIQYFESAGHMVVIDGTSGEVKFFQDIGYGFRGEEIGKLLKGKEFLAKTGSERSHILSLLDEKVENVLYGGEITEGIEKVLQREDGYFEKGIYEIHKRPMFCLLARVKKGAPLDGVYLMIQDASLLEKVRKERTAVIEILEQQQKKHVQNADREKNGLPEFKNFIGTDPCMQEVKHLAYKAAHAGFNVIITGESGTGKSRLAREIHNMGMYKNAPFVEVNCNAIAQGLFESELFGYVPGAFTGALSKGKVGLFEAANGGTIFLDEIGDLPMDIQVKLLHVLQNKKIYKVGASEPIDVDVRIITATNRDLEEEVREGRFRRDLYYRIYVYPIKIPPLRQRNDDLYVMINSILEEICARYGQTQMLLSEEALNKMMHYSWPGNVRELENVLERAVTICDSPVLYAEHILIDSDPQPMTLKERLWMEEKRIILETLAKNQNNHQKTMKELGITKTIFYEKLKRVMQ